MRNVFDTLAQDFDKHAALIRQLGKYLLERLDYVQYQPKRIVDLGTATGFSTTLLQQRYPEADIIGLDQSLNMLFEHKNHDLVQARAESLPFATASVDLLFANMLLPCLQHIPQFLEECKRVLTPEGLLLFNSLGPDTLKELKKAYKTIDNYDHVNTFVDMHDLGDWMLAAGLSDPALDTERLQITYPDSQALFTELKALGSTTHYVKRQRKGLMTQGQLAQVRSVLMPQDTENLTVSLEIIYGLAWGNQLPLINQRQGNDVFIPVSAIHRQRT